MNETLTVTLNGATVYTGTSEDAAEAAWTKAAKAMRWDDELTLHAGDRLHRAATKPKAG